MLVERNEIAAPPANRQPRTGLRFAVVAGLIGALIGGGGAGCVRRTLTITSEPEGALCWLNGREVGRTPVTVDFLYYGKYDVQLTHEGFEPLLTFGEAKSPLWDTLPLDLASEVWPGESHADIRWHYVMQSRETDRDALIDRAQELREKMRLEAPIPPGSPQGGTTTFSTSQPATQPAVESELEAEPASQPQ
jgi:hypothetical protein